MSPLASSAGAEILVVGAGMVGAACAFELVRRGFGVTVIDAGRPGGGATAACMGHVVVMDDSEAQFALGRYSQELWDERADELGAASEVDPCGTLWLAEDDDEMAAVDRKHAFYGERGVRTEKLDARALRDAEPELRADLLGALRVPGDSVVYPPAVVERLLELCAKERSGFELRVDSPVELAGSDGVVLRSGERLGADAVVICGGVSALDLLPEPFSGHVIRPRKGHLAITERRPGFCRHQLVELGYLKSAHGADQTSVAFNLQPRATGQMLLGSSRQFGTEDPAVEPEVVAKMIDRGRHFLPRLGELRAVRLWTGFRPSTDDHLPLIGPVPGHPGLWLAAGHEGLGITTSFGTARLIADGLAGVEPELDPRPYLPSRSASHA